MEQAINTFSEGLLMDIHPLMQSDKVLSDALNATINTMNGNECILQNDMGNRRVDNAFLPAGYEPVGIKEYGGIIYVASYNPITNKSLIGSFPSPERRIGMNDSNNGGSIDFNYILSENNITNVIKLDGLPCIKSDSILSPITGDVNLHAGDKFVVYVTNTGDNNQNLLNFKRVASNYLSNYNNVENGKIKTPKNKLYTLSLGVLNSQNEFVDITKNLVRWDDEGNIILYENQSDLYKFNDGYFISESDYTEDYSETISDANLIEERKTLPANTYAYKLVGPLYLKLLLNHITNFNYNIYGVESTKDDTIIHYGINENTTETITLSGHRIWIEGIITYNCPDGGIKEQGEDPSPGDQDYESYEEYKIKKFNGFNLLEKNGNSISALTPEDIKYGVPKYDKSTNTYQCVITKEYFIEHPLIEYTEDPDGKYIQVNNEYIIPTRYNSIEEYQENSNGTYVKLSNDWINIDGCLRYSYNEHGFTLDDDGDFVYINDYYRYVKIYHDQNVKLYNKIITGYKIDSNGKYVYIGNEYVELLTLPRYSINHLLYQKEYVLGVVAGITTSNGNPFEHAMIFDSNYDLARYVYIEELSSKITIDFSLFGSNTVRLREWRFKNDFKNKLSTLTYAFDAYPKYGESFSNLVFKFVDVTLDNPDYKLLPALLNNGRTTMMIDWAAIGLEPRKLYKVSYTFDSTDSTVTPSNEYVEWFLTTELFNDWYGLVLDYGNPPEGYNKDQLNIKLNLKIKNIKSSTKITQDNPLLGTSGNNTTITFTSEKTIDFDLENSVEFNENNYPDYISLSSSLYKHISNTHFYGEGNPNILTVDSENYKIELKENTGTHMKILCTLKDIIEGQYDSTKDGNVTIDNGFIDFLYVFKKFLSVTNFRFAMLAPDFKERTGHRDDHWIYVFLDEYPDSSKTHGEASSDDSNYVNRYLIEYDYGDHPIGFRWSRNKSKIIDLFNRLPKGQLFTWGFDGTGQYNGLGLYQPAGGTYYPYILKSLERADDSMTWQEYWNTYKLNMSRNARLWWRTTYGEWALFDELIQEPETNLSPYDTSDIENLFSSVALNKGYLKNIIFSFYKNEELSTIKNDILGIGSILNKTDNTPQYEVNFTATWKSHLDEILLTNPDWTINHPNCEYVPRFKSEDFDYGNRKYETKTESSDEYISLIENLSSENIVISNIELKTGKTVDSNGDRLNINYLYKSNLDKINTNLLTVSEEYAPGSNYRGILYNGVKTQTPTYKLDWTTGSDSDCTTYETYDDVVLVEKDY